MKAIRPLILSEDFRHVLDLLEKTQRHLFITGRAGTGKSTLLQLFRNTTRKNVVVLAPTGIAALNVQGQTIHSFFGFPPRWQHPSDIKKRRNRKIYQSVEMIVIDEISMVRADLLDHIDLFLRINRDDPKPFGGIQMVFFGDLFQLPPVVSREEERQLLGALYETPYFFSSRVLQQGFVLDMIELTRVYRQEERQFIRLLDAVRTNRIDYDDLEDLNERFLPAFEQEDYFITLTSKNMLADGINQRQLNRLSGAEYRYMASISGDFDASHYPVEPVLRLRVGAQVMFVRNDPEKQFVNGTIGTVESLDDNDIRVRIYEGQGGGSQVIEVQQFLWEIIRYQVSALDADKLETEVIGSFTQYPLRLAWAITIHKSQGKTFDKVIIDLGTGAFEYGQTYVALSRCRTLQGIVLKQRVRPQDVLVDERVIDYYASLQ